MTANKPIAGTGCGGHAADVARAGAFRALLVTLLLVFGAVEVRGQPAAEDEPRRRPDPIRWTDDFPAGAERQYDVEGGAFQLLQNRSAGVPGDQLRKMRNLRRRCSCYLLRKHNEQPRFT